MVSTRSFFAQFAHRPDDQNEANTITSESAVTNTRWSRVVSPSPSRKLKKRKAKDDAFNNVSTPKSSSPKKKAKSSSRRSKLTESFSAVTANNFTNVKKDIPPVHTLILGTHPSIKSLAESQYYGHSMNAFWWIAGDCLGFRRAEGLKKNGDPFGFVSDLEYDESYILSYEQQLEKLCLSGFALWDIVKECERPGSLDQDISKETVNDIRGFCQHHPSIKRIVFSNGGTGCAFFKKHFQDWLESGELVASNHKTSQDAFKRFTKMKPRTNNKPRKKAGLPPIECVVALPVSPAAATYKYHQKRDFWKKYVYGPGLKDFEDAKATIVNI